MANKKEYPRRIDMIMAYLRSFGDKKEEPKKKKKGEKSIAELINFGGDYDERAEGGVLVGENTGKTTQAGRTVYKTPEGEMVSEKSTTFKYKGKWINIPSIVLGEKLSDEELKELLDEGLIEPTSTHDELEEAEKAAQERSNSLEFNKGGTSMDEQMKMFGEGGLFDEGGQVDEESGNDVPIGGTKEGVRDDIPAMLSEGEFVFPEDVTRYHGLEKLMKLRQEAKMGLKKMEAMGQMGNSEEATMPDDLPFNMDDLLVVVTGEEEESKKKYNGGVIHAQAGTFVPATQQQQSNTGIMGYQESMYGNQPVTGQPVMPPVMPPSPVPTPPPVGGYTPPTVLAEPVDRPGFVEDVSDLYKPVKYINPTSGDTMMINEYQGNPVSAVPAGFVRYDEYIAGGGKPPEDTGVTGTGVETTQVSGGSGSDDDERKAGKKLLDDMKTNKERKRIDDYNNLLSATDKSDTHKENLIDAWLDNKEGMAIGAGMGVLSGPLALVTQGFGKREGTKIESALTANFGDTWKNDPRIKEFMEKGRLGQIGAGLRRAGSSIASSFTKEGRDAFYEEYKPKYSLSNYKPAQGVQGYIKGASGNNLNVRQQQQFDNAVNNGDTTIANHFALVARGNAARDAFAKANASDIRLAQDGNAAAINRLKSAGRNYGGMNLSSHSIDQIIKYGSSINTAINEGRAKKGGFLQPVEVIKKGTIGSGSSSDDSSGGSSSAITKSVRPKTRPKDDSGSTSNAAAQIQASIQKKKKDDSNRRKTDRGFTPKPKPKKTKKSTSNANKAAAASRKSTTKKSSPKVGSFRRTSSGFSGGFKQGGFIERK